MTRIRHFIKKDQTFVVVKFIPLKILEKPNKYIFEFSLKGDGIKSRPPFKIFSTLTYICKMSGHFDQIWTLLIFKQLKSITLVHNHNHFQIWKKSIFFLKLWYLVTKPPKTRLCFNEGFILIFLGHDFHAVVVFWMESKNVQ